MQIAPKFQEMNPISDFLFIRRSVRHACATLVGLAQEYDCPPPPPPLYSEIRLTGDFWSKINILK